MSRHLRWDYADGKSEHHYVSVAVVTLALGGLGPQWAVIDADTVVAFKDKPLKERFALCPWGLYHIDVKPR